MRVGDHQLGAPQATTDQALKAGRPEGLRFRWPDMQTDDLAFALGVCRHSDYRSHADDAPALALFEIGGVEPEIRTVADDQALEESISPGLAAANQAARDCIFDLASISAVKPRIARKLTQEHGQ